jgi:type II pantothenate kinase
MKLAFDFGITNTDVVSYKDGKMKFFSMPSETINKKFLDKLLLNAEIELKDIDVIAVTGGKSSDLEDTFKNIPIVKVNEVEAIGYGAKDLYNISEPSYLVVSCGTGTACVASIDNEFHHMGGISVGGGTLQGLSNLILGEENAEKINTLAADGNKDNLDSLIGEVVNDIGALYPDITASNFAKARYGNNFLEQDISSSLCNMVGEVIGTVSYLNALMIGVSKIYFIGRVSLLDSVKKGIDKRLDLVNLSGQYEKNREYGNAVGAIAYLNANT